MLTSPNSLTDLASLAATTVAGEAVFEFARLESIRNSSWLAGGLLLGLVLLLLYVWLVYRREARTISLAKAILLATLRTVALAGLVAFLLGLEKRSSEEKQIPSRVVVLADNSLSMSLPSEVAGSTTGPNRYEQMLDLLADSPLLEELSQRHEVEVMTFGEAMQSIAHRSQQRPTSEETTPSNAPQDAEDSTSLDRDKLTTALEPSGRETRMGDALSETLQRYRGLPLAAIVVLTDGGQNSGLEPQATSELAKGANVAIHTVGFGPTRAPKNLLVREVVAPERAYPGDAFTLQGIVQSQGFTGTEIETQVLRRKAADDEAPWQLVDSQPTRLAEDDSLTTVRYDIVPEETGQFEYEFRVSPQQGESQNDDNYQRVEISIVERKTSVLLFAGGPSREYQFLRNQLRRDKSFTVDVLLQTAVEGVSQDANQILFEFPARAEELATYDVVVAMDPDWTLLSAEQANLLEQWVARQAGGMVIVPGHIHTPKLGSTSRMRPIRGLYPIRLGDRLVEVGSNSRPRDQALPLEFTREGSESKLLWLADSPEASRDEWQQLDGVFGPVTHLGPKAGASVLVELRGEDRSDTPGPAYVVSQFYGAGQVILIGSAETWRLREIDTNHFDRLWTQLLRHVSQGRLLQGSPRGKLLVSQDRYEVGTTVALRAMLSDVQLQPLTLESVTLRVELPSGGVERVPLTLQANRPGSYAAEMRVVSPGTYRLELPLPDSDEVLTRTIRASVPQLEVRQTIRNEDPLKAIASLTGGYYYPSRNAALEGNDQIPPLAEATPSQSRSYRVVGQVDKEFATQQSLLLLTIVAGALSLEWIIRRLSYLA